MRCHIPPEIKGLALRLAITRKYPYKKILHIIGVNAQIIDLCFFQSTRSSDRTKHSLNKQKRYVLIVIKMAVPLQYHRLLVHRAR